jgi:hypothetical protein
MAAWPLYAAQFGLGDTGNEQIDGERRYDISLLGMEI